MAASAALLQRRSLLMGGYAAVVGFRQSGTPNMTTAASNSTWRG
jgi:hypothetical protein